MIRSTFPKWLPLAVVAVLLVPTAAIATQIISPTDQFPIPLGRYEAEGPTTYPSDTGTIPTEIVSMSLVSKGPSIAPPTNGGTFQVDSFFDVFTEISIGGSDFVVDSFFDITYRITDTTPPTGSDTRTWDTEIVSMDLSGSIPGGPTIVLRRDQNRPSGGQRSVTDLGNGTFQVDSFFDVFTEIRIDGGAFQPSVEPTRLRLTGIAPEPSSFVLLSVVSLFAIVGARRRQR